MRKNFVVFLATFVLIFQNISAILAAGDTNPPKLISASINKKTVKVGETIILTFNLEDKESGLSQIGGDSTIELQHQSGQRYITHLYNVSSNQMNTKILITPDILKGVWKVSNISVKDKAGNSEAYTNYDPKIAVLSFDVLNGLEDRTGPLIKGISVINKEYRPGEKVKVELSVEDQSGIVGVNGILQFKHSLTDSYMVGDIHYNNTTKKVESFITVPEDVKNGTWELFNVNIRDKYSNEIMYFQDKYSYFRNYKFSIIGGSDDFTPPVLKNINLNKTNFYNGEDLSIEIDAYDKSEIYRVDISFIHRSTYRTIGAFLEWDWEKKKYTANIKIPLDAPVGEWEVYQLYLRDVVGNYQFFFPHTHPNLLPNINVLPLFTGTENLLIPRGTVFHPLQSVLAKSDFEGNLTDKISLIGNVDTNTNGIYLLKYTAPSKSNNYIYEDYRWITVDDGMLLDVENGESTVYFDSDILVDIPTVGVNISLYNGKSNTKISKGTKISTEGEYRLSLNTGASAMSVNSIKPLQINKTLKFIIDKTAPVVPRVNKITTKTTIISGKTDKKATVNIGIYGRKGITVKANKNGYFSAKIPKLKVGTKIKFTVKDRFSRSSKPTIKVVSK
jgi:hypothetical protein